MTLTAPRKLDIACGTRTKAGFTGIDLEPHADIVHDLFEFPWPIKDNVVREVNISHFVEHIPHWRPGWDRDGWWLFWEEVHRICRNGASVSVLHPYVKSDRAFWDPTHTRYIHEATWWYLDPEWRRVNELAHYTSVDFELVTVAGSGIADDFVSRSEEAKGFAQNHYWNIVPDLAVELRVRK